MSKLLLFVVLPLLLLAVVLAALPGCNDEPDVRTVAVARGTVVRYATATGRIEPRFEVPVTSRNGGLLTRRFVALGQRVAVDEPLFEVRPVLTDRDMLQAERNLLYAKEAEENAHEVRDGDNVMGRTMLWYQGEKNVERMKEAAARARSDAEEQMQLLTEGRAEIEGKVIDYLVRAPIEGNVIELAAEVGQPIVPASEYGPGTQVLVLADMATPIFRGAVNEIDVGRLREGMKASLDVGALPGTTVEGELVEISLRSRTVNNATVFDVKLTVVPPPELVLRAGYSAVARIEIERADDVLVLPERVVTYRGDRSFVLVDDGKGGATEREVSAGLSDGLAVEITDGLAEGDEVLERTR